MAKIDDEVGVGLLANCNLRVGVCIEGAESTNGRHISREESVKGNFGVERESKKRKGGVQNRKFRKNQIFNLHGPLSFVNHACIENANCIQYIQSDKRLGWKRLSTTRPIRKK